jgi:heme-degrading monooxygenase HmoA
MFIVIWEFEIKNNSQASFERVNGPNGEWAKLFKRGEGYLGTELVRDLANPQRYLTIDRWVSQADYDAFRQKWRNEYEAMDQRGEALTASETKIGSFETF